MNAKPKDAIAALRHYMADRVWPDMPQASLERVLAWADSIPEGAVPVVWPADLTRERLEELAADESTVVAIAGRYSAIRALAAIAPQKKPPVKVDLWRDGLNRLQEMPVGWKPNIPTDWHPVARNVELED